MWARETIALRRELHRAQCRAARRVYDAEQETSSRCLGALQVYRVQQQRQQRQRPAPPKGGVATGIQQQQQPQRQQQRQQQYHVYNYSYNSRNQHQHQHQHQDQDQDQDQNQNLPRHFEELAACNQTGKFERFGDTDIAFVCDFCDGYLVWEDLREMPSIRAGDLPPGGDSLEPLSTSTIANSNNIARRKWTTETTTRTRTTTTTTTTTTTRNGSYSHNNHNNNSSTTASPPAVAVGVALEAVEEAAEIAAAPDQWQATAFATTTGIEKTVVFAPVAIANHVPATAAFAAAAAAAAREWRARILCPYCDEYYYEGPGDDEVERTRYNQDEAGFEDVHAFQEHLEWYHTSLAASLPANAAANCAVM